MDSNEGLFEDYLRHTAQRRGGGSLSNSSIESYLSTLFSLSKKLREEKLIDTSLFEINDMKTLVNLHDLLLHGSANISKLNKRQDQIFSAALYHYITMLSLQPEDDNFEEIVRPMAAYKDGSSEGIPSTYDDLVALFKKAYETPKKEASSILQVKRDRAQAVRLITLSRADDRCDLCGKKTFLLPNNHYFLECHHLVWLSDNGVDSVINTVALCPNCHRMMHLGLKKEQDDSFERLLEVVYHYLKSEAQIDNSLPEAFVNYFKPERPEVCSF